MKALANNFISVMSSPDPENIWTCSPGLCVSPVSGRIIATGGFRAQSSVSLPDGFKLGGRVFCSDDKGITWKCKHLFSFKHARPFYVGNTLYIIGHDGDLMICASYDDGETFTEASRLSEGQRWHQAPCNVLYGNGCVYLVMERLVYTDCKGWEPSVITPVLMRAETKSDLTKLDSWTFASELVFRDVFDDEELIRSGMAFFPIIPKSDYMAAPGRECGPPGWLETNIFRIYDDRHYFYDPEQRTIHLTGRSHLGWTNYAFLLKVIEDAPGQGRMTTAFQKLPSGGECRFIAMPGGHMKFHILFDDQTKLYWLLSTQSTDSMTRAEFLSEDRYNLPNNQRSRLVLHFSKNMIDWCFAGLVAVGGSEKQSRHYASMAIDGDDLLVLSRSGDEFAASAHNGNLITFHKMNNFRELVY